MVATESQTRTSQPEQVEHRMIERKRLWEAREHEGRFAALDEVAFGEEQMSDFPEKLFDRLVAQVRTLESAFRLTQRVEEYLGDDCVESIDDLVLAPLRGVLSIVESVAREIERLLGSFDDFMLFRGDAPVTLTPEEQDAFARLADFVPDGYMKPPVVLGAALLWLEAAENPALIIRRRIDHRNATMFGKVQGPTTGSQREVAERLTQLVCEMTRIAPSSLVACEKAMADLAQRGRVYDSALAEDLLTINALLPKLGREHARMIRRSIEAHDMFNPPASDDHAGDTQQDTEDDEAHES